MRVPPGVGYDPPAMPLRAPVTPRRRRAICRRAAASALLAVLAARAAAPLLTPLDSADGLPPPWRVAGLPHQKNPLTQFSIVALDGRRALRVESANSYGNLVHPLRIAVPSLHLAWQWRVDDLLDGADLHSKAGDDAALKVCVFFDLPLDRVPFVERQLLRLARTRSDEPLPGATVCYVWDTRLAPGTVLDNAYTRRVRFLVLRSGPAKPHEWRAERRDVAADFLRLFGDETPQLPPVVGVAVGADADNTHGQGLGHVAGLVLEP